MSNNNYVLTPEGNFLSVDELYRHGIKGMKWGVRRYQNYDGSYTKAGMKRYNEAMANYEKADERYKTAKAQYKNAKKSGSSTTGMETEITNAKLARKQAKAKLEKDYKHLKQDELGDQGKKLYANGRTITSNKRGTRALATVGSIGLGAAAYNAKTGNIGKVVQSVLGNVGNKTINQALAAVGVGATAVAGAKAASDYRQNKRLRAYYSHTSNY